MDNLGAKLDFFSLYIIRVSHISRAFGRKGKEEGKSGDATRPTGPHEMPKTLGRTMDG